MGDGPLLPDSEDSIPLNTVFSIDMGWHPNFLEQISISWVTSRVRAKQIFLSDELDTWIWNSSSSGCFSISVAYENTRRPWVKLASRNYLLSVIFVIMGTY
ncbi:hypothetical protein ACH5RR_040944 [Cinchona calisaya]|uniref:Uncharacterized protein n=1 Tax=Cinchona calisaya TaxID=153742 RepID=A0ABD2XXC9_9GENT